MHDKGLAQEIKGLQSGNPHKGKHQEEISCKANIVIRARTTRDLCKWREWHDSSEDYLAVRENKHLNHIYTWK